jgi:surfactin synthase thioesterase subunit
MPGARFRLFCFPCAGASASSYAPWAAALPPDIEAFVLQLPGRSERFQEAPITDLRYLVGEIAAAIRDFLDRPFVVLGHSLGALLGFELIRQLRRQGAPMPRRLFVAGRAAPQVPDRDPPISRLPDDDFIAELRSLGGLPDQIIADRDLLGLLLPTMRADIALHEAYVYRNEAPLECPLTALGGTQDPDVSIQDLRAWRNQTVSHFELRMFDGDHFFIHPERKAVVSLLLDSLVRPRTG